MEVLFEQPIAGGRTAFVACTDKSDGDLSLTTVDHTLLAERRAKVLDLPWRVCRQVHSDRLVAATNRATDATPVVGDALMTAVTGQVVAVHSADCAPIGFVHHAGAVAAAHAGWKGLERGVLETTVRALRARAHDPIVAVVGPHIRASRYEFGQVELDRLAQRFGPAVVGRTHSDTPALDLTHAISAELARLEVPVAARSSDCTAENSERYWSHRARGERGRFALLSWIES